MSLLDNYKKIVADKICVSIDDLTDVESKIIEECFDIFKARLEDIKILEDENKRISIELSNLKAYSNNKDYDKED